MIRRRGIVYGVVLGLGDWGRSLSIGVCLGLCVHSWHGSLNEVKIRRLYLFRCW